MEETKIITDFFVMQEIVHELFGYMEDWRVIPLMDQREDKWFLDQNKTGHGNVYFHPDLSVGVATGGQFYSHEIYTQRFLPPPWVWRSKEHVLICVDTRVDLNKYLSIFKASNEITDELIKEACRSY